MEPKRKFAVKSMLVSDGTPGHFIQIVDYIWEDERPVKLMAVEGGHCFEMTLVEVEASYRLCNRSECQKAWAQLLDGGEKDDGFLGPDGMPTAESIERYMSHGRAERLD